jgi:hypothetical protein
MQTETKTVTQLPIMKYFDDAKLVQQGKETLGKWRKGERPISAIIALIAIGLIGWGSCIILPIVFAALGKVIATVASILAVLLVILLMPAIFKLFRRIVRWFHKAIIRWNPFDELDEQKQKMWETHDMFLKHKSKIKQLRNDFEQMSNETRTVAENSKTEVQRQTKKAGEIKAQMEKLIAEKGEEIKRDG